MPLTSDSLALGTCRAPHSPRCWRVASMIGKTPYIPGVGVGQAATVGVDRQRAARS